MPAGRIVADGATVSLFHVAARRLGDAQAYWRILQASGLTDPWLDVQVPLLIPALPNPQTGGLPA